MKQFLKSNPDPATKEQIRNPCIPFATIVFIKKGWYLEIFVDEELVPGHAGDVPVEELLRVRGNGLDTRRPAQKSLTNKCALLHFTIFLYSNL